MLKPVAVKSNLRSAAWRCHVAVPAPAARAFSRDDPEVFLNAFSKNEQTMQN